MDKQELYNRAKAAIIDADEDKSIQIIDEAEKENFDLLELLLSGFGAGNSTIGERFESGEISLPELIYAAEVMKNVTNLILDKLQFTRDDLAMNKGRVLLATVAGDVHDIGKGIVASTLRAAGFDVIDLGCEVPVETIIEEARKNNVDIIGTSALLTSTMLEQKKLEKLLSDKGFKEDFITMVGGAPCTQRWAKKIGAGAYSEDAIEAVKVALNLIQEKNNKE